jgi:hypothetical protein
MVIEFFQGSMERGGPKAAIRKNGVIGLNRSAMVRYGLGDGEKHVLLGYDAEQEMIAVKVVKGPQLGARRLSVSAKNGTGMISASSFFNHFGIRPEEWAGGFELSRNEENDCLVFFPKQHAG